MDENEYNIEEISDSENKLQIVFSGNLTIDNAGKLHTYFQNHCIEPKNLNLNFDNVESLDLSILQIITALLIKRNSSEKKTKTKLSSNSDLNELLHKSGMLGLIERLQKP